MRGLLTVLFGVVLASSLVLGQTSPGAGTPPPPDGGQMGPGDGGDFQDEFGDDFEDDFEDDDMSDLTSVAYDLIYALEDYAYENCNSKKDKGKFNSAIKVVRQLLGKLNRLPGVESEVKEEIKEVKSSVKDLSSSLKDICDPAQKEDEDSEDDDLEDDF